MDKFTSEEFQQALRQCAEERIHQIGCIQPHGAALVLSAENPRTLLQSSNNLADFIDLPDGFVLGRPLTSLVGESASLTVEQLILAAQIENTAIGKVSIQYQQEHLDLLAHVYRSDGLFVLELERDDGINQDARLSELPLELQQAVLDFSTDTDISFYFAKITNLVRSLTGFDSVMVYRFDENWDGDIINQSRVDAAPSYLGSHFPATDIPPQARALYTKNLVRIVADTGATRVPVLPELNPVTQQPLDMTYSALRSLSPVHLQYMRNMGFQASMVISLLQNDHLWGLIACHHLTPKRVSIAMRQAAIFISHMASANLSSIEAIERSKLTDKAMSINADLLTHITSDSLESIVTRLLPELQSLLNATGLIMVIEGKRYTHGKVTDPAATDALFEWLENTEVYSTSFLSNEFTPAKAYTDVAAGLLTVNQSFNRDNCILWLREDRPRTVKLAGNYEEGFVRNPDGSSHLNPRNSFKICIEQWRGRSMPWSEVEISIATMIGLTLSDGLSRKRHLEKLQESQKIDEEAVRDSLNKLDTMTAEVPGAVYQLLLTPGGKWTLLYASKGIEDLFELTAEMAYQDYNLLTECILPEYRTLYRESVVRSASNMSTWEYLFPIRTKSNTRKWVQGRSKPQQQRDGSVIWNGILSDVTERIILQQKLEYQAKIDPLTGLANRRSFFEDAEVELLRAQRYNRPLSILMMDIDLFKSVNDTYGHKGGDLALQELASVCKNVLRAVDIIGRLGGEEFAILLPETAGAKAQEVAERMRQDLEEARIKLQTHDKPLQFTVSIGIASMTGSDESIDSLLQQADSMLFKAKQAGRNRVVTSF